MQVGAGGGGAGGVGSNSGTSFNPAGLGGPGYSWPITNSYYAAGGTSRGSTSVNSIGGYNQTAGVINTGSGGGGATSNTPATPRDGPNFLNIAGGAGGSGVVILAMPTPNYPGSAPGATVTTPPAAPGKTVLTYTSSGTFTA